MMMMVTTTVYEYNASEQTPMLFLLRSKYSSYNNMNIILENFFLPSTILFFPAKYY